MKGSEYKPLSWSAVHLCWLGLMALAGFMIAYRTLHGTIVFQLLAFDGVPLIRFLQANYQKLYWSAAIGGGLLLAMLALGRKQIISRPLGLVVMATLPLGLALLFFTCRAGSDGSGHPQVNPMGFWDWLTLVALLGSAALLVALRDRPQEIAPKQPPLMPLPGRLAIIFLLCLSAVFIYALVEHLRFWSPETNGGYRFARFFREGEIFQANQMFYFVSLLFAALSALLAQLALLLSAAIRRMDRCGLMGLAMLVALAWSSALMLPWQSKIWAEIRAEGAWLLPLGLTGISWAAMLPLIHSAAKDLRERSSSGGWYLSRAEASFMGGLVFLWWPLVSPLVKRRPLVWACAGSFIFLGLLTWLVNSAALAYEMDDWRSMIRSAQFPFLRVFFSLALAGLVYLSACWMVRWWRLGRGANPAPARPIVVWILTALPWPILLLASWPLWGFGGISLNTQARTAEYSHRHRFELSVLHWLLDFDGDSYSALLHGNDPDDGDPEIHPGGLEPFTPQELDQDRFARLAPQPEEQVHPNPEEFGSLLILFLEGVTPRAISAYGLRDLPDGLQATPHLDSLAAEGLLLENARACFPCTWDAWFAVNTGRLLRPLEMSDIQPFRERYSPYNNLYRVLKEHLGTERFCHASAGTYADMLLSAEARTENFEDDFDPAPSAQEQRLGITRGDKRISRMLRFLDSIEPGQRFFMVEHMSDTHFPWRRTSLERARQLGFPNGLEAYERDAYVMHQGEKYSLPMLARYFHSVSRMDSQVGLLLAKLKERGLFDQTTIVVVGDHGCQFYEHEHAYYVSHLYEQTLHIPMIIRSAGHPGLKTVRVAEPVLQVDVLPTLLELAGLHRLDQAGTHKLLGVSLVPFLEGRADGELARRMAARDLIMYTHYDTLAVLVGFRHKLIFDRPSGTYLLFDLHQDPQEMHNLADERPELLEQLLERMRQLSKRYAAFLGGIKHKDKTQGL